VSRFGGLDILFNNAGIPMGPTPADAITTELFDRIFAVNVRGVFVGCKYAIPVMRTRGGGVIINTASTAGIRPRPGMLAYAASKGAVITLTKALALELAPTASGLTRSPRWQRIPRCFRCSSGPGIPRRPGAGS
jgi:3-oxoacyl-[acyl-carrier protein] reductase